jgi:radical SAM-linked protein
MKAQRLRLTFSRGEAVKYITHLDLMRTWERALRRAGVPVSYSEGFSPHAQIAIAAPLPVGTTSDAELMDVFLDERMTPRAFTDAVTPQLPAGLGLVRVREAAMSLPSLQADARSARYEVDVPRAALDDAAAAARAFLAESTVPWEHKREDGVRTYDIRSLVHEIEAAPVDGGVRLTMLLRNDNSGSGRPDQVVLALGLPQPARIHRTALVLAQTSPVREAWRKRGRFAS